MTNPQAPGLDLESGQFIPASELVSPGGCTPPVAVSAGAPVPRISQALLDVAAERQRQDLKWGGPDHDDMHSTADFVQLIRDYAGWARTMAGMGSVEKTRRRLVQVAALAVAAVESLDRTQNP